MTESDEDLRGLFADVRRADSALVPPFERVLAGRKRSPRRGRRLVLALAATVVIAVGIAIRARSHAPTQPRFEFPIGQLEMPTDFLLNTLGSETLRSVPSIATDDWFPQGKGGTP